MPLSKTPTADSVLAVVKAHSVQLFRSSLKNTWIFIKGADLFKQIFSRFWCSQDFNRRSLLNFTANNSSKQCLLEVRTAQNILALTGKVKKKPRSSAYIALWYLITSKCSKIQKVLPANGIFIIKLSLRFLRCWIFIQFSFCFKKHS